MFEGLPDEWDVVKLINIADIDAASLKSTTPPDFSFYYIDISSVKTGVINKPVTKIYFKNSPSRARRILKSDDVLMATVRPNLQSFAYFGENRGNYICSTGFAVIRSKNNNGKFIFHNLFSESISSQIDALVVGSNYPAINSSDVKNLLIPNPPLPEQKKIAKILTSVDEVIETTETQINKLKDLKTGLMNELLTKGIGHTEFKDSPVGRIPVRWEVTTLKKGINLISGQHIEAKYCSTFSNGMPYLTGPADFPNTKIIITKYTNSPKVICKHQDILLTVKGSGCGRIIISDNEYCISRQLMAIRVLDWILNLFITRLYLIPVNLKRMPRG